MAVAPAPLTALPASATLAQVSTGGRSPAPTTPHEAEVGAVSPPPASTVQHAVPAQISAGSPAPTTPQPPRPTTPQPPRQAPAKPWTRGVGARGKAQSVLAKWRNIR
jgi:hypothetical protein